MTNFIGEYNCKLDEKGRLLFPAGFKKQSNSALSDKYVVKKDIFESCLVLYPMEEWERQNQLIRSRINPYNKEHNQFLRMFFQGAAELELDSSNRLLLPKRLLELVKVQKEVIMAGQYGKIEIWAKEIYESSSIADDEFAKLAEKLLGNSLISGNDL